MDYNKFIKVLKKHKFKLVSSGKHQQWSNGDIDLYVPHKHKQGISKGLYCKFMKQLEEAK